MCLAMDDFLALKLRQAGALVLSVAGVVLVAMGAFVVRTALHPPGPLSALDTVLTCGLALLICAAGVGLEAVAVWLCGKALTLLNAALNTVITAAALGAGLLSARMSYTQLSALEKFFLVVLTVAAAVGGALFFFGPSGKGGAGGASLRRSER